MQIPQALRILVAEDNIINQTLFTKMLSALGYKADVVDNGMSAMEAFQAKSYDMVFMDYQMPDCDGLKAATNIKNIDKNPKPVVILMTANLLVNDDYLSHPGVIDDFLKKPFTLQEIAAIIEKWQSVSATRQPSKNK